MKKMRLFGNMVNKLCAEKSITYSALQQEMDCTEEQVYEMLSGCVVPTFAQLEKTANLFGCTPEELLEGDPEHYEKTVVHCMNEFENPENREEILDIIESFATLVSVTERESAKA